VELKKILVTGGAGFIGTAVVRHLLREGAAVVNLDKLTYAGSNPPLGELGDGGRYVLEVADICDRTHVAALLAARQPDAVMHLAAETHVDRSIDRPDDFVHTNIVGTFTLLEVARAFITGVPAGVRDAFRFLHVSTDEVYGSLGREGAFSEETAYAPNSPYAASKAGADHLVRAYAHTYGLPVLITNCSNNYGPFQFPEKLIPLMVLNAIDGRPLPIYGDGGNVRDWLHVEDHCAGVLLVLAAATNGPISKSWI
jgi:dTDP-glucose 4,6-dehydratase